VDAAAAVQYTLPDSTPPSVPTGVHVIGTTPNSVSVAWTASTDNVGVAGYRVLRDGAVVATLNATSYTDSGRAPATSYRYSVPAYDAAGNASAPSPEIAVTTAVSSSPVPT